MKTLIKFMIVSFIFATTAALADKIVISGQPIVVEKQADVYVVPSSTTTVTTTTAAATPTPAPGYYYYTIDNVQRVCYKEVQPGLANVNSSLFSVKIGSDVVQLHCYDYSPEYFVVQ